MFPTALHGLPGTQSWGIFPSLLPKHPQTPFSLVNLHQGLFCRAPPSPTWKYSGVGGLRVLCLLQIPPKPQRMGFAPFSPCQNFQRDHICFPPPWLCSKRFKGAAQAGFTHNFLGFLAQIPNLTHRPGELTTTTTSLFLSHTKAEKAQAI